MISPRRSFLIGAASFLAAPSIVRAASLMPVSALPDIPPAVMPPGAWVTTTEYVEFVWVLPENIVPLIANHLDMHMHVQGVAAWRVGDSEIVLSYGSDDFK